MVQLREDADLLHHLVQVLVFLLFDSLACNLLEGRTRPVHAEMDSREAPRAKTM